MVSNDSQPSPATADLGRAYAAYLRRPSSSSAASVCQGLTAVGRTDLARALQGFVDEGAHIAPAPWWGPDATCEVRFSPPPAERAGQLWFDPLELTCFILNPYPQATDATDEQRERQPSLLSWVAMWPVTQWQLLAAHSLTRHGPSGPINAVQADTRGVDALAYTQLFDRVPTSALDWRALHANYGETGLRKLWGGAGRQFGGFGSISGYIETITLEHVLVWDWFDDTPDIAADEVDEWERLGLPFRSRAAIDEEPVSDDTIQRVWHPSEN